MSDDMGVALSAGEFSSKLDRPGATNAIRTLDAPSGPFTDSYEQYVHKIFTPAEMTKQNAANLAEYTDMVSNFSPGNPLPDISPAVMARMERMEDKRDEDYGQQIYSPLEMMYSYYGQCGLEDYEYKKFPVYQPKTSSEYHSILNKKPKIGESPAVAYKVAKTHTTPNLWSSKPAYESNEFKISTDARRSIVPQKEHYMLLDYKKGEAKSPFLYPRYDFVHNSDSRIVGSDFVMLNLRQDDPWKNRVDKLLELAKET